MAWNRQRVTKHKSYETQSYKLRNAQVTKHKNVNCEQPLLGFGLSAANIFTLIKQAEIKPAVNSRQINVTVNRFFFYNTVQQAHKQQDLIVF